MRSWLRSYNVNLPLLDVINDPDARDVDTRLAALSLGEGLDSGYYDAEVLADAVAELHAEIESGLTDPTSEARRVLADLLMRGGAYTRSLFDEVKSLGSLEAVFYLDDHATRMRDRADMGRLARDAMSRIAVT
jgi:hypothetical protein